MKKIIFVFMTLSTGMFAQTKSEDSQSGDDNNYCAKNEMNKIIVVYRGAAIIDDAKLENGTLVKIDGTLIMKDGSKTLLREGQCINRDGTMPTPSE